MIVRQLFNPKSSCNLHGIFFHSAFYFHFKQRDCAAVEQSNSQMRAYGSHTIFGRVLIRLFANENFSLFNVRHAVWKDESTVFTKYTKTDNYQLSVTFDFAARIIIIVNFSESCKKLIKTFITEKIFIYFYKNTYQFITMSVVFDILSNKLGHIDSQGSTVSSIYKIYVCIF